MTDQTEKCIERIAAYQIEKLHSFELLMAASEFTKFNPQNLINQAEKLSLSQEQQQQLIDKINDYENTTHQGSWSIAAPTVK